MGWCGLHGETWCSEAPFSKRTVWIPIITVFLAIVIAVGTFCRWRGIRRRRQLDLLEALQRAQDDLEERFVDYGEKPTMFDVSTTPASKHNSQWSSWKPISVWCEEHAEPSTEATGPSRWMMSSLASEQMAKLHGQMKRLRSRMNRLNGHREDAADSDELKIQLDKVSVAVIVKMPSNDEENEDGVLPELVFAIQDVSVVG